MKSPVSPVFGVHCTPFVDTFTNLMLLQICASRLNLSISCELFNVSASLAVTVPQLLAFPPSNQTLGMSQHTELGAMVAAKHQKDTAGDGACTHSLTWHNHSATAMLLQTRGLAAFDQGICGQTASPFIWEIHKRSTLELVVSCVKNDHVWDGANGCSVAE